MTLTEIAVWTGLDKFAAEIGMDPELLTILALACGGWWISTFIGNMLADDEFWGRR